MQDYGSKNHCTKIADQNVMLTFVMVVKVVKMAADPLTIERDI